MNAATKTAETPSQDQPKTRRDELILEHLHLVNIIAKQVQHSISVHTELDDLAHAGTMGLFEAATHYKDDKAVAFPVYAKHRIRGAILDSLRQLDWASRDARKQYRRMEAVTRDLTAKLQRTPTQAEIAEAMGLDERKWKALMIDFRTLGLTATRQNTAAPDEMPNREIPCALAQRPDHEFARSEMRQKINLLMTNLPERHQQVVKLYYEGDMTMKEIGSFLGVNESRVSQIHRSALGRLHMLLGGSGISSVAAFSC